MQECSTGEVAVQYERPPFLDGTMLNPVHGLMTRDVLNLIADACMRPSISVHEWIAPDGQTYLPLSWWIRGIAIREAVNYFTIQAHGVILVHRFPQESEALFVGFSLAQEGIYMTFRTRKIPTNDHSCSVYVRLQKGKKELAFCTHKTNDWWSIEENGTLTPKAELPAVCARCNRCWGVHTNWTDSGFTLDWTAPGVLSQFLPSLHAFAADSSLEHGLALAASLADRLLEYRAP